MVTRALRVTAVAGGQSASRDVSFEETSAAQVPLNFGETAVLPNIDTDNANKLLWQDAVLAQPGPLQSLSFFVEDAAGKMRLGLYNTSRQKLAETAEFTPVPGWNTVPVIAPVDLAAGTYWLLYHPNSNALRFRVGSGGTLRWYNRAYGALPATLSSTFTTESFHWSMYGTILVDRASLPPPPPPPPPPGPAPDPITPGVITNWVQNANNWHDPWSLSGFTWYNEHPDHAYNLQKLGDNKLQMEIRAGEIWAGNGGDGTSRSEILTVENTPEGVQRRMSWDFTLLPGQLNQGSVGGVPLPLAWLSLMQSHSGTDIPFTLQMSGERMFFVVNFYTGYTTVWTDTANIVRGQKYHFDLICNLGPNGFLQLWRDGVQIVNYNGNIGNRRDYTLKLGIYRGWNEQSNWTIAGIYENIVVV